MKRVIIESPYGSDDPRIVERNEEFLWNCAKDCLARGEAPFASHGFYTQFLDDHNKADRALGMECGHAWMEVADYVVVYEDHGVTPGMSKGIDKAIEAGKVVIVRSLRRSNEATAEVAKEPMEPIELPHPDVMPNPIS